MFKNLLPAALVPQADRSIVLTCLSRHVSSNTHRWSQTLLIRLSLVRTHSTTPMVLGIPPVQQYRIPKPSKALGIVDRFVPTNAIDIRAFEVHTHWLRQVVQSQVHGLRAARYESRFLISRGLHVVGEELFLLPPAVRCVNGTSRVRCASDHAYSLGTFLHSPFSRSHLTR